LQSLAGVFIAGQVHWLVMFLNSSNQMVDNLGNPE
jgi:hypothetical protein